MGGGDRGCASGVTRVHNGGIPGVMTETAFWFLSFAPTTPACPCGKQNSRLNMSFGMALTPCIAPLHPGRTSKAALGTPLPVEQVEEPAKGNSCLALP